jgi:signal transduction histidine kinase/ligand-binding sensor domain-containing protein
MLTKHTLLLVVLLSFLYNGFVFAQQQNNDQLDYSLSYYTEDNGLSQNSVKNISADSEGFIWLTTEVGLVRFDGNSFYTYDKSNLAIPYNRFSMLQPSLEKGGKKARKLYAVAGGSQYVKIEAGKAMWDSSYTNRMHALSYMKKPGSNVVISNGSPNYMKEWIHPDYYIIPIAEGEGNFYVLEHKKIGFYSRWKKNYDYRFDTPSVWDFFTIGKKLYSYTDGIFTRIDQTGLTSYSIHGDLLKDQQYNPGKQNGTIYWNNVSKQVFLYLDKKLYVLKEGPDNQLSTKLVIDNFDFISNNITSIHHDETNKRFFLGSVTKGLFVLKKKHFVTLRTTGNNLENVFYGQAVFDSNAVITPKGYILGKSKNSNQTVLKKTLLLSLKSADGYGIITDKKGNTWHKSGSYLSCINVKRNKWIGKWNLKAEINHLYEGNDGTLWIGTRQAGLFRMNLSEPNPVPRLFIKGPLTGISFILEKTPDTLAVGTGHGLFFLPILSGKITFIKGTENFYIRSLYIPAFKTPKQQEIWITTYENGFFLLINKKLVRFPLDKRKYLRSAHCIVEDKLGYFWITTNKGLFRFSKRDLLDYAKDPDSPENNPIFSMYYTKEEGFYTNEFNGGCQPCALRLPNGYVSLPSLDGLVWFTPEDVEIELPDKNITMEHYEVRGKNIASSGDSILLPLDPQQIKIYLTTAYYGNPANLNISYAILKNPQTTTLPDEWLDLDGTNPVISIGSLRAGNYTLLIRKKNGFGRGNQTFKKIFLIVPLNWYQTRWFQLVALLILLFLVYLFTRLRFRFIRKENQLLELKIARRTRTLEQTYTALEKSEKELHRQIYIQSRLIAAMSHDIKTPLKFVSVSAGKIENMLDHEKTDAVIKLGKMIEHSSVQMYNLLENLITYVKTQVYGSTIVFEKINLYDFLSEKLDIFNPVMKEHSNQLINETDMSLVVWTNPQLLGIVVHNLVDNANKFSFNGIIKISTAMINNQIQLIVSDTGPGIPDELIRWLNTPSLSDSFEKSKLFSLNYSGLGLTIVKEISVLLEIEIRAEKVQGTKVYLVFPEFKSHN